MTEEIEKAKAKAVKEFAEKVKEKVWDADTRCGYVQVVDIGDIEELCSRIIIIDEGKKIYDGTLERLK